MYEHDQLIEYDYICTNNRFKASFASKTLSQSDLDVFIYFNLLKT